MLRELIHRLQSFILARPRSVLTGSVALVLVALALGSGVELRTSRSELAPAGDPDQARLDRLTGDFRGSQALIACVEALPGSDRDPAALRAFADALAAELARDPAVAHVFHRVDAEWLLDHALYLVPPGDLERGVAAVRDEPGLVEALARLGGPADLNRLLADRIARGLGEASGLPGPEAVEAVRQLAALIAAERRFLEDPAGAVGELIETPPLALLGAARGQARDGYLQTLDGEVLFVVISPVDQSDSLPVLRKLVRAMRARATDVASRMPGFRVALTGPPAMTVEEMDTVRRDSWVSSILAALGVTLLTLLVFRWKSHAILVLVALGVGLTWAFGAVRLELGYLNTLTSAFIPTLIGVGVAYGIHPISEYELEGAHTVDPFRATRGAYHATGTAVSTAAVTTAAAFFSIQLMQFPGFAELGLVAGWGVLLCLLASLVTLPALTLLYGRRRARLDRTPRHASSASAVDRLWVERAAAHICRYPRLTVSAALALTALSAWAASGIRFNTNLLDLLPDSAESLRYMRRMTEGSDLSPVFNMVVADDLGELERLRTMAGEEPAVARFDSVLDFIPADPAASREAIAELERLLDAVRLPEPPAAVQRDEVVRSLERLEQTLDDATEAAFGAGLADLLEPLERARVEAAAARQVAAAATQERVAAWGVAWWRLVDWGHELLARLRDAADAGPPTPETLPEELRDRFITESGRYIGFLYPVGSVFDPGQLGPYIEASRRVSTETTGFPLMFYLMSNRITSGFYRAVAAGSLIVMLILLIDYRRVRDAALAMIPLAIGLVWMLGGMRWSGIDFNFANLVGVPLIIGVGIDNGVHVIHRMRLEGSAGMDTVLRHTGRAILISSLTTMIGFGSLALASHRGLASLGVVLLLGVGSCLLTSTIVLPNLLVLLGLVRR